MENRYRKRTSLGKAALKGAIAATVGGMVMKLVWDVEERTLLSPDQRTSPTREAVEKVAEKRDIELSDAQKTAGALTVYGGNMAMWGAIYGMVQSRLHPPDTLHGLALGGLIYAANFPSWGVLPQLRVLPPPSDLPTKHAAIPIVAHVAFGLTTAAVFDALN